MEAGPLGMSGYRLRSREKEGSRAGGNGGERRQREEEKLKPRKKAIY